jgi:diguanylate cyclase (GGDEF)-like protein
LPNRVAFQDRLAEILQRAGSCDERAAVLCIDLDRFKEINDSLGHAAGDQVLVDCAERLRDCVRETDLVARLGGDEFAILLTGMTRAGDVQALCERILASLADPMNVEGTETVVGASIGVALIPGDGSDAARVLQNADIALYRAKFDGRNRACYFEAGMDKRLRRRKELETALRMRSWPGSSRSTISRRSRSIPQRWSASRRCSAGGTPNAARLPQRNSFLSPRRAA